MTIPEKGSKCAEPQDAADSSSEGLRETARSFIEAHTVNSDHYGADIIVLGRVFEDALVELLKGGV